MANDVGLQVYVNRLIDQMTATTGPADAAKKRREQIEAGFIRVSIISFEFLQSPQYMEHPDDVVKSKHKLADQAYSRLQKGEAFETVAKDMSEEQQSASDGGLLGCVPMDAFGREVEKELRAIKLGDYSKPIRAPWGYCILKPVKLTDDDINAVLKSQAGQSAEKQVYKEFQDFKANVRIIFAPDLAPATKPGWE